MTAETTSRVDRLLSLFEASLSTLASEFDARAQQELQRAGVALENRNIVKTDYHHSRAIVYLEAERMVHRQIIAINNEVLK